MAQSSRLGGHMAEVHEAMLPFTVKGKAIAAADMHMLTQLRTTKTGEAAAGGLRKLLVMHHSFSEPHVECSKQAALGHVIFIAPVW